MKSVLCPALAAASSGGGEGGRAEDAGAARLTRALAPRGAELLLRYMLGSPGKVFSPEQRYHRVDPLLPRYTELDDVSSIPELVEIAKRMVFPPPSPY
jgi:hypothetical protein